MSRGHISRNRTFVNGPGDYTARGIECLFHRRVEEVDANLKKLVLEDGTSLFFDKLILATGSRAVPYRQPKKGIFELKTLANAVHINPVHFGLIVVLNLSIGFITPPVGLCLHVLCGITKLSLERVSRAVMPFLLMQLLALLLITYIPFFALVLPRFFGFVN